jgi:hypothetical protein
MVGRQPGPLQRMLGVIFSSFFRIEAYHALLEFGHLPIPNLNIPITAQEEQA